jgi:hypothetical protein
MVNIKIDPKGFATSPRRVARLGDNSSKPTVLNEMPVSISGRSSPTFGPNGRRFSLWAFVRNESSRGVRMLFPIFRRITMTGDPWMAPARGSQNVPGIRASARSVQSLEASLAQKGIVWCPIVRVKIAGVSIPRVHVVPCSCSSPPGGYRRHCQVNVPSEPAQNVLH